MNEPFLLCVKGEHKGIKFTLGPGITTVGRSEESSVVIADPMVSRNHGAFYREDQRVILRDRGSANGVFVNGAEVKERLLQKNDVVDIGPVRFLFNADLDLKFASRDGQPIYFTPSQAETIHRTRTEEAPPSRWDRESQKVMGFLKTFSAITSASPGDPDFDSDGLANLVDHVKELFNADCAVLLMWEDAFESLQPVYSSSNEAAIWISKSLISKVFSEGRPDGLDCTLAHHEFDNGEKETPLDRSCIAAPLLRRDKPAGVIYLHKNIRPFYSHEDHVQLGLLGQQMRIAWDYFRVLERYQNMQVEPHESSFIFKSDEMKSVLYLTSKAAQANTTVLILGETGVGKEVLAKYVHNKSPRAARPFVVLNCASIPAELFESELFGHERGSFTGAHRQHKGKIEVAHTGTLFLDEIGEMTLPMQAKMLRFLQDKVIYRVGGTNPIYADARIIAATNRNLDEMVREGQFREDLLFRLNVMQINIPPLRNRRADILPLIQHFFEKYSSDFNKPHLLGFSDEAIMTMERYAWPGNVRELENAVERAVLLAEQPVIELEQLRFLLKGDEGDPSRKKIQTARTMAAVGGGGSGSETDSEEYQRKTGTNERGVLSLKDWERLHIQRVLEMSDWNQQKASMLLGIHRNTLRNKIMEYDLEKE